MEERPTPQFTLAENSAGGHAVTRGRVRERAVELAVSSGRSAQDVAGADWAQAKRELMGEPDTE